MSGTGSLPPSLYWKLVHLSTSGGGAIPVGGATRQVLGKIDGADGNVQWQSIAASDVVSGTFATARLGSGTPDATKFLRGDQTWAVPPGFGNLDGGFPTSTYGGTTALDGGTP